MNIRKTFAIIAALAVGGVTIPLLANLIPLTVNAIFGIFGFDLFGIGGGNNTTVAEN